MKPLALVLALAAASCLALASVIQHEAARNVPDHVGPFRLFLRLLRMPRWLLGRAIDTAALVLQAFALAHGSLIAVQAAITTSVVIALGLEVVRGRRRVHAREVFGAAAVVGGVTVLLLVGRPSDHSRHAHLGVWLAVFAVVGVGVAFAISRAHTGRNAAHLAFVLAIATGVCFSLDAAALKAMGSGVDLLRVLLFAGAFALAAITGNVLVQRAFQIAPLNASLPVLTATTPVAGAVVGIVLFREEFRHGIAARSVAVAAVLLVAFGALLAARAPYVEVEAAV